MNFSNMSPPLFYNQINVEQITVFKDRYTSSLADVQKHFKLFTENNLHVSKINRSLNS
jgi:hypothetical protein